MKLIKTTTHVSSRFLFVDDLLAISCYVMFLCDSLVCAIKTTIYHLDIHRVNGIRSRANTGRRYCL